MIGDMFNNNRRRDVITREGQLMWYGKKYRLDKTSGYYVCTTGARKRLHVVMWEQKWGCEVPPGCVIHHLDWDKSHNDADNLVCLTTWEHEQVHNVIGGDAGREFGYGIAAIRNSKEAGSAGIPLP